MKTITRGATMRMHNPPHPGEILQGLWLDPMGISVTAAARSLGISRKTLSKIVNGHGAITPEMAVRLEMVFGTSAETWLGHQVAHDLWLMESRRKEIAREIHRVAA